MKQILLLIIIIAGLCFFYYKNNKKGDDKPVVQNTQPTITAEEKIKMPPPEDAEFHSVPDSFTEQLIAIVKSSSYQALTQDENYNLMKQTVANSNYLEFHNFLNDNELFLQECRDLTNFSTLGIKSSGSPLQDLPYLNPFRKIHELLLISAEYQINFGDIDKGLQEIDYLLKLQEIFHSETPSMIHLLVAVVQNKKTKKMISNSNLPKEQQNKLLAKLPDRKYYANMLKSALESEKIHVLYYREWADALPELFKDFPDDNAKREKIDFAQKLKKIPTEVVEEICDQYNNAIIAGFEENNLEEINLLELGSSKAHKILYSSYYEKLLHSISKMSKKVQY